MFKGVCERVCAPAGAGVTGAGLRPAPVTSQRQASHEVVSTLEARTGGHVCRARARSQKVVMMECSGWDAFRTREGS